MRLRVRGHFDGQFIVPEQPVDLPINQSLDIEITMTSGSGSSTAAVRQRIERLNRFFDRPLLGDVQLEALRRENIYEDRR